jgi:hypothetical protein
MTSPGVPVGAVSRGIDKLDVFCIGPNGRVYAAAWHAGETAWQGWWTIGSLVCGMSDPEVGAWHEVGLAFSSENTAWSEEAQGMTTDGAAWFLSSNGSKTIRKYGPGPKLIGQIEVAQGKQGGHVGAPGCFRGWIYVPVQKPYGVWKTPTDLSAHRWLPASTTDNRFPWCDVNPLNGRLYTSMFDISEGQHATLFAYDRDTLGRRPEDDIVLGPAPICLDRIQGAVFTIHGRVIMTRTDPNALHCFSALTGHCFGAIKLDGVEMESVTVRPWQFAGTSAHVHVLELDNDASLDDCYLHSFHVPDPERL